MSAVLKLITQVIVAAPPFDNTNLGRDQQRWISDNAGALTRYFHDLTMTLPIEEITETSQEKMSLWARTQYDLEVIRRSSRLPHGGSL